MALAEGLTCCACTGGRWFLCESCKIGQRSSSSRDGSTPMHGQTFCRKLKHFKQIHTVPFFCRTLIHLVNSHAFALCRPKISFNGCSVSALTLSLLTAHMVLTTTSCSCTLQSYRVRLGKDCLQLSVWSILQVCPSTFNTHSLAFAAMLPRSLCKLCLQCCLLFAERPYATQDAIKVFFEKLYQYNPALNPAAFMLDKDKSEHYAAGSVIIDRAVEGIRAAIQKLQSLTTDQFEQPWQTSAAAIGHGHCVQVGTACQLEVGQLSTHTGQAAASENIQYLAAQAAHEEDLQLGGSLNTIAPAPPSCPAASDYQAALLCSAVQLRDSLLQLQLRYSQHQQQPSAWASFLHVRSAFLQRHAVAPVLQDFCKQFLHTVLVPC